MTGAGPVSTRLSVTLLTDGDPRNPDLLSGVPHAMLLALGEVADCRPVTRPLARWFGHLRRATLLLSKGRWDALRDPRLVRAGLRRTLREIERDAPDLVFAVTASPLARVLVNRFRVVQTSDATAAAMRSYYPTFAAMSARRFAQADAAERDLLNSAMLSIYPSDWARNSALADYAVRPDRAVVIPWGANLSEPPQVTSRTRLRSPVRLLFVGKDWDRKGGRIAMAATRLLVDQGVAARLDVVGCGDEALQGEPCPDHVRFHGLVSRRTADGRARIDRSYEEADLFILPTRAECYGIVFAEAAHHGVPTLAYRTGGVPTVVRDGETGLLLPLSAGPTDFAAAIRSLIDREEVYARMSAASLAHARDRLTWQRWAVAAVEAMHVALRGTAARAGA